MGFRIFILPVFIILLTSAAFPGKEQVKQKTITYDEYITAIEQSLPELKDNETGVLSAENKVKSAKSSGDIYLSGGGSVYSEKTYYGISDKGNSAGYNFYAGLSKKVTSTGTTFSSTYNYSKDSYSDFSSASNNYSAFEPSLSVKVTQPLLYNFLGKVDRYSENNARMQLDIAKHQLQENNRSVLNAYKKLYFQWIMYSEKIRNLDEAIVNSDILKEQVRKKVNAGLADNDDYQGSVSSALSYENQRRENETGLKNIEHQMSLYVDIKNQVPDIKSFQDYYSKAGSSVLDEIEFKKTASAKIMDLTMKNYSYSKGVYENKLLPELNAFAGMTKKDISGAQTYSMNDTDYSVGFELKYYPENNAAESALKDIEIQIRSLEYEYKATENSYRKKLLGYIESSKGVSGQLANKEKTLKALESKLVTERKKYNQARLSLSYVIDTENSITSEKNNILILKNQLIGNYIDYMDIIQ